MKKRTTPESYIGIFATRASVTGILMRRTEKRFEVVGRFVKHRMKVEDDVADVGSPSSSFKTGEEADFMLQVATGPGSNQFVTAGKGTDDDFSVSSVSQEPTSPFLMQVREILADAAAAGFSDAKLVFCIASPDLNTVELQLAVEEAGATKGTAVTAATRKKLLKLLPEQYTESFEAERTGFLPMVGDGNSARFLSILPVTREPVVPTVRMMALQMKGNTPGVLGIHSDIGILSALISQSSVAAKGQRTAVVRVGTEDTAILLFDGPTLQYFERLRSITTYDSPEKVCSRIMLQQDESKIGDLDNVIVLSDARSDQLVESFRTFYPDAVVEPMQSVLEEHGANIPSDQGANIRAATILSVGAVLVQTQGWAEAGNAAAALNSIPRKLLPRETGILSFAWHTAAMLAVLFVVTFVVVTSYMDNAREIDDRRQQLLTNVSVVPISDPTVLQGRVDSLQRAHQRLTASLHKLDSLLIGSDRWSRFLESVTRATRANSGVWLQAITPKGGSVEMRGEARSRSRVADFARQLNGQVSSVASLDVQLPTGELTIYRFTMSAPVPVKLPEAAAYLREVAINDDPSGIRPASVDNVEGGQ